MLKVMLANQIHFDCQPEQRILEAARHHGIILEHSCRTGRCGVCKAVVVSGETTALQPEVSLTESQLAEGYILTCCRTATTSVQLDIEDLGALGKLQVKTLPCRIDHLQPLTDDVLEVTLRTPPAIHLGYVPGQYVDMIGKDGLRRSYSIANAPRNDGKLTLQIRKVPDGEMSQYWFSEAKTNDLLRLEGPLGTFSLRKTNLKQIILLATGTGIAPIKSLLEQLSAAARPGFSRIHLYWGGRTEQDIYWQPKFPNLPLEFTSVLSRSPEWSGRKGYVQHAVLEDRLNLPDAVVYACGSEAMIHSAHDELVAEGLSGKNFFSDAFVSSN
ncbi:MAG: NAD(P)H-flavin reductase [Haliea sp.]|uniref:FAD-binding oxidoreductase n=1 Tax=Haliea sp. TaxID=1932666 RepID=UPI000C3AAB93|nr:FAD-binding oxidoreductase [Haliea sp.]MBM70891.1 NAD(P)H-flavin reductase [Haliea sp.]|tara:strand:- start:25269 stop:26252 length:984 start_codon:yes stop_codon:yes gene_type:complete